VRYIAQVISRAWNALIPTGDFISRLNGSHHTYCHTCQRFHTDGCHPWRK